MRSKLPATAWGHAVLYATELIRIRPSREHIYSPLQLHMGHEPDISRLKTFSCAVYVPIAPPERTKWDLKGGWGYMLDMTLPRL